MIPKKTDDKKPSPPLSLASRLLGSALRNTVAAPAPDEPWRNKNAKRKSKGKRSK
jgi:hypothetical protein